MRSFVLGILFAVNFAGLSAQIRIDSAFAFGSDPAKRFSVYLPSAYSPSAPNALVIGFHPYDTSRWNAVSWCDSLKTFGETNDVILICPDGDSLGHITDSLDYAFTSALIDSAKNWYNIDERRIYALGFSEGGKAVYEYGLNNASKFGGFIPVGPSVNGSSFVNNVIHHAGKRPFYLIHGGNDAPNQGFYPMLTALYSHCALVDSILMAGIGHTFDFPGRNAILTNAFNWVDSVNLSPMKASFSLNSPLNFSTMTIKGFSDFPQIFNWGKSPLADSCGVLKYEFMFDLPNGGFVSPLLKLPSGNGGLDTTITLFNRQMDSLLAANSIPLNGSLALDWTVMSDINGLHSDTAKSFRIVITRKKMGFNLISPSNSNTVVLQNGQNKFFDWEEMNHYISVNYKLMFDDTSGNFSAPKAIYESSGQGISTSVNMDHEQLYYDLMFRDQKVIGDTIVLKWRVLASDTVLQEMSLTERLIIFIRGNVGFKLKAPVDQSILTSKKDVNYSFSWDSVLLPDIRYEWRFDTLGVDLNDTSTIKIGSDDDSSFARAAITYNLLDSIMNVYDIQYLDTLYGQWTCRAIFDGGEEYALNNFDVTIVRAHPVGMIEVYNNNEIQFYPNPVVNEVFFKFNRNENWYKVEIFDNQSRQVLQTKISSGSKEMVLNVSGLKEGNYIWKLSGTSETQTGKMVISR